MVTGYYTYIHYLKLLNIDKTITTTTTTLIKLDVLLDSPTVTQEKCIRALRI